MNGNKLRLYRLFKERIKAEDYVVQNMPRNYRQLLSKLRCDTLPIAVETGRYEGKLLNDRVCKFCDSGAVEDEVHIMMNCQMYDDLQHELFQDMQSADNTFNIQPVFTQFLTIMSDKSCQYKLAKYLSYVLKRRRLHEHF